MGLSLLKVVIRSKKISMGWPSREPYILCSEILEAWLQENDPNSRLFPKSGPSALPGTGHILSLHQSVDTCPLNVWPCLCCPALAAMVSSQGSQPISEPKLEANDLCGLMRWWDYGDGGEMGSGLLSLGWATLGCMVRGPRGGAQANPTEKPGRTFRPISCQNALKHNK